MMRIRKRLVLFASFLAALAAIPVATSAAPHHNRGLTINATPNPNFVGDPILIYGELKGPSLGGQTIRLFHRVDPAAKFTFVQKTLTNTSGFYEFTKADGAVLTDRSWYVRGPAGTHSRTVDERVSALLTLTASAATGSTSEPITFTGSISPTAVHVGEQVILQRLTGSAGNQWRPIASGVIEGSSTYAISRKFLLPGAYELRTVLRHDASNVMSTSDPATVIVQQAQEPSFTINTSSPTISNGQPVTISGVLYTPGSMMAPRASANVTLWGHEAGQPYTAISSTSTGADGSYAFTLMPEHNMTLQVRTALLPSRRTAQLFEGVADAISIATSAKAAAVGQIITFIGTVTPDKAGDAAYLQLLGPDSRYHTVKTGTVTSSSTYSFAWTFGSTGLKTVRVRLPSTEGDIGGASQPVTVSVSLPPIASLPPAS